MNVVLGASGMLGQEMVTVLQNAGRNVVGLSSKECNLTHPDCIHHPILRQATTIFNCAAYTNVPKAETEVDAAFRLNRDAVSHLIALARETGCYLIHVSTDFVFDGHTARPYDELALSHPLQTYGASKRAGEMELEASDIRWLCARTSWLFGHGKRTFVSAIRDAAQAKGSVSVVTDEIGTPTYAPDLAQALLELAGQQARGMLHASNAGVVSRFDFAREIVRQADIAADVLPLTGVTPADGVKRPAYSALAGGRLEHLLGRPMRPWQETLRDFFAREAK